MYNAPVKMLLNALQGFDDVQDALLGRRLTPAQATRFSAVLRGIDERRDTIAQAGMMLPAGVQAALQ